MLQAGHRQLQTTLGGLTAAQPDGFFEDWSGPPTAQTLHLSLCGCHLRAPSTAGAQVIGSVNAISDGVLCPHLSLLEVRPQWRGQGRASRLLESLFAQLDRFDRIDTLCDDAWRPFYARSGMTRGRAMFRRNSTRPRGQS